VGSRSSVVMENKFPSFQKKTSIVSLHRLLVAGGAAMYCVFFLGYFHSVIIKVPYWDQIHWFKEYFEKRGNFFNFIWRQTSDHRNVFSKLAEGIDLRFFHGQLVWIGYVMGFAWIALFLMAVISIRKRIFDPELRNTVTALLALCAFSTSNFVFTAYPVNLSFLAVSGFAVLAFSCVSVQPLFFFAAPLMAFFAHLSSANGLLVWPICVSMVLLSRERKFHVLYFIGMAMLLIPVYFVGEYAPALSGAKAKAIASFPAVMEYFFLAQGLPWSIMPGCGIAGMLWGGVLSFMEIAVIIHGLFRWPVEHYQRAAWGTAVFALASSVMIAPFRFDVGNRPGGRYTVFTCIGIMAVIAFVIPFVQRWWQKPYRRRFLRYTMVVTVILSLLLQVKVGNYYKLRSQEFLRNAKAAAAGKERNPTITDQIYTDRDSISFVFQSMKDRKVYLFRKLSRD
jgi:hypothetical protein